MKTILSIIKIIFKIIIIPISIFLWIMKPTKKGKQEIARRRRNEKQRSKFKSVSTSRTPAQRAADWKKFGERKKDNYFKIQV